MARGDLLCPICNQLLGLPSVQLDGNLDRSVGSHVHVFLTGTWTCSNGHRFRAEGNFTLHREA